LSRNSPAGALAAGTTGDNLLAALRIAGEGVLPQPLEYLIGDVARRHGAVRVCEVPCCLRSDDRALLAEILRSRLLVSLRLSVLAPTVIGSAKRVRETLAALHPTGYAPVAETADEAPVIERVAHHRAVVPDHVRASTPRPSTPEPMLDPATLAAALLAAAPTAATDDDGTIARLRPAARHLPVGELRLLAHAIDEDTAVHIEYTNAQGRPSSRVIEEASDGHMLDAWCTLREDDRVFALSRVTSVAPV